jgi:hypothetical protein
MKKYLGLLFILAAFVYSCKKSGNRAVAPNASIVGTWFVTNDSVKEYNSSGLTSAAANIFNKDESDRFNADGTGYTSIDTIPGSTTFTYTIAGGKVVIDYITQNYKGDEIDTARIGLLTATSLELIYKGYVFDIAGSTEYYETDVYFTRQPQISE